MPEEEEEERREMMTIKPDPDPTRLTTEQLNAAIRNLKDFLIERMDGRTGILEAKVDGHQIAVNSKFQGVEKQFVDLDTRTERNATLAKEAVAQALQAQKESVGAQNESIAASNEKMENAFTKQIDQQGLLITSGNNQTEGKINDMKDRFGSLDTRIGALESRRMERIEVKDSGQKGVSIVIASIVGAFGIITGIVLAIFAIFHH